MPLDAHVLKQARKLKLLAKEPATMVTARKLTAIMAGVFPGDPLRGDFALFGHGRVGEAARTRRTTLPEIAAWNAGWLAL